MVPGWLINQSIIYLIPFLYLFNLVNYIPHIPNHKIEALRIDPDFQGKMLVRHLAGLRSLHTAGRYRIIYRVDGDTNLVSVLAAGIRKEGDRKDIYEVAKKLLRLGLLE